MMYPTLNKASMIPLPNCARASCNVHLSHVTSAFISSPRNFRTSRRMSIIVLISLQVTVMTAVTTVTTIQRITFTKIVTSQQNQLLGSYQCLFLHFCSVLFSQSSMGLDTFSLIHSVISVHTGVITVSPCSNVMQAHWTRTLLSTLEAKSGANRCQSKTGDCG